MPFSLFEDVKRSGFHSSILTTYSVDPAFYDANIQYRLRASGCLNNLLMADASMLSQALEQLPEAFTHAGRKYLIAPVEGSGCFHPKIALRYGKSKATMTLGSANATSAGWGSNREIVSGLSWSGSSGDDDEEVYLRLIAAAHDWLLDRLPAERDADLAYKLELISSQSPWLADADRSDGFEELNDGSLIDLLLTNPGSAQGIGDRFIGLVGNRIERLVVISPYWDTDLGFLERLHSELGGPAIHVFLTQHENPAKRQSTFPVTALGRGIKPKFHPLSIGRNHRFLHAKMILAQTRKWDHVLYGSPNCTNAALGANGRTRGLSSGAFKGNFEAALFRRLARGMIEEVLGLDFSATIKMRNVLGPPKPEPSAKTPGFHPGRIERKDGKLFWSVPSDIDPVGAKLTIDGRSYPLTVLAGGRPHVRADPTFEGSTIIAVVVLHDGRTSRPIIVVDPETLKKSAPSPFASGIKRKLDSILNGDSELIDLAREIHLFFGDGPARKPSLSRGGGRGRSASSVVGQDFPTPEEFRAALSLKGSLSATATSHADSPVLQLLLKIVLRGIVSIEDSDTIDQDSAASIAALDSGERQDDEGDDEEPTTTGCPKKEKPDAPPIEPDVLEQNRRTLDRAVERFEIHVATLAEADDLLDLGFVTHALIMIYLMLQGCSKKYGVVGSDPEVLMPFSGIGTSHEDYGFLKRAARLIQQIWGRRFSDGLMARIPLDRELTNVPTPILTLVILSRWILAAILNEARAAARAKQLTNILESQIPQIYRSTAAFAIMDPSEVDTTVAGMALQVGMSDAQAKSIQRAMAELENSIPG